MTTQGNGGPQLIPDGPQAPLHRQIADFMNDLVQKASFGVSDDEIEDVFEVKTPGDQSSFAFNLIEGPRSTYPKFILGGVVMLMCEIT